jgi:hypothetical protein
MGDPIGIKLRLGSEGATQQAGGEGNTFDRIFFHWFVGFLDLVTKSAYQRASTRG